MFAALAVSPCLAGEGFLNRNAKVNDAIPYGRAGDGTPAPATPPTHAPPDPTAERAAAVSGMLSDGRRSTAHARQPNHD